MVGILTFHWADDYGAMLQAYALKRQLELLGEEVELVPYAPLKLTGRYRLIPICAEYRNGKLRYFVHRYMAKQNLLMGRAFWERRWNMRQFRRAYLTPRRAVKSAEKISLQKYKTVFVGSDQVWNPEITVGLDDAYTGSIPQRGSCRLAAYGASMGGAALSEADRRKFAAHVGNGFSAVSLREKIDVESVEQMLGRSITDVLDPVLLLDHSEWERIGKAPSEQGYILLYLTEFNLPLLRCAQALSRQTGGKLISVSKPTVLRSGGADAIQGIEERAEGGPAEFFGWLQNADCVLTNSFHGTAFSVLLEKDFLSFRHNTRSVRQEDLLCKLGLEACLVEEVRPDEARAIWANTDWGAARACLRRERERSKRFILENI